MNSTHRTWINQTESHIRNLLGSDAAGHDWFHIDRVRRVAIRLGREMGADLLVVELAALLHDVADWKFHGGDETVGPRQAESRLAEIGAPPDLVAHVTEIVRDISFKGAGVETPMRTIEGQVVQDADRLDAIGAIGIARAFAYGGAKGRLLHDPDQSPELHASFEAYKRNQGPTLNHFFEKLFLPRDRLNTPAARALAEARHEFMQQFVDRFLSEWEGNS